VGDDGAESAAGSGNGDDSSVEVGHEEEAIRARMTLLTIDAHIRCTRRATDAQPEPRFAE
jgi:hypothetical protein